ncbi:MAG TPA: ABC transporter permease [Terriglobales bacterium]|nr:ABC transporter permease [Terriglobales bacterium]
MNGLLQDVKYGFRMLRRNPGFTALALLALGLGIGANTALFSVVYGVLLKPLPYAQGKELVVLQQDFRKANATNVGFSVKEIQDYRGQSKSLAQVEEYHQMSFILLDGQEPQEVHTGVVSAHFFDLLGVKPYLGRLFRTSDDVPGADAVLVLSYGYWKTRYGGDPSIVGRHFRMNDKVHTVIGVLPPVPQYPRENDVYMTTVACPFRSSPMMIEGRSHHMMQLFGRLKPGADVTSGNADVAMIASRLQKMYPADYPERAGYMASMNGLRDQLTQRVRPMLLVLLAMAGLVLLIACANVANLALARMMRREQEMAVRTALGANRARLVRQLLTESTLLSLAGGALGLLLASECVQLLATFIARFTTRAAEVAIDTRVLLFTLGVSLLTGLIFGSIPAFSQKLILVNSLKESGASTAKRSRFQMRNLLVMGQVALSFMLLIGAGLMIRSFIRLQRVNAGYNADNVLTVNVPFNFSKYQNNRDVVSFFDRVEAKLEHTPGVLAVGVNSGAPLAPGRPSNQSFIIEGRPALGPHETPPTADLNVVTPDAFKLLGVPLVAGRFFTDHDNDGSPQVVIISQSLEHHYFPNEDPLNKRVSGDNGQHWATIVGVVGDVKYYGLDKEPLATAYQPLAQSPNGSTLLVKTQSDPLSYLKQVRDAVYSVDPEQPVNNAKTLDELRGDTLIQTRLTAALLALFAALALAIAATGLSGVTALLVSQRTREIGIRMALGAKRADVLKMVLSQSMTAIGTGLAAGLLGALAGVHLMKALLYKTSVVDPVTFLGVAVVLSAVALVASYLPARRATQVDPLVALRTE